MPMVNNKKEQNNEPENNVYIISKFIYTIDIHCIWHWKTKKYEK